jgi:hypothetical protein
MKLATLLAVSAFLMFAREGDDPNDYVLRNGTKCPPEGTAASAPFKTLNALKNRNAPPKPGDMDHLVSLAAMIAPGADDTRFNPKNGVTVTGYVMEVTVGGKESCNCKATNPIDRDTHIALSLSKTAKKNQRVIVEVTPRLRKQMKAQGVDWSTDTLKKTAGKGIKGKWVEVTGWLLFDFAHTDGAENSSPGKQGNWRATCWEVHPVTSIKVLAGPPQEVAAFQPESFGALQATHARHVRQNPKAQAVMKKRNEGYLAKITEEERKEIEEEKKLHRR